MHETCAVSLALVITHACIPFSLYHRHLGGGRSYTTSALTVLMMPRPTPAPPVPPVVLPGVPVDTTMIPARTLPRTNLESPLPAVKRKFV